VPVQLLLARHGETVWHLENRYAGSSDIELDDRGRQQAELLADWAKEAGLAGLWSSDLRRARDTAAPVARATGLAARVDPRLRELHFGRGEGRTMEEMAVAEPDRVASFLADPVAGHLPDGEDPVAAADRGLAAVRDIAAEAGDGRVLVVCHSTLLRLVLCRLLGLPLAGYRRLLPVVRNCGITELGFEAGRFWLLAYNAPIDARALLTG
jgi:broad specificity phosphatase PhoE